MPAESEMWLRWRAASCSSMSRAAIPVPLDMKGRSLVVDSAIFFGRK